jgi:hypothetical protein
MRTFLILFFIVFLLSNAKAQVANKIDKLDVNQLRLPKESVSKASYIDATGQVKSSSVTDTELGYLSGLTDTVSNLLSGKEPSISSGTSSQYWRGDKSWQTLDKSAVGLGNVDNTSDINKPISTDTQTALNLKANDADVVKLTGNQSISGVKTFTGKIVASTTINGSIPCPVMTQTQRNAFSASQGDCVYNTTSLELNVYDGTNWKSAGGSGGGISLWLTGTTYAVDTVVIESDKIYRCLIAHTSGTFATDLSASKWIEVSQGLTAPVSLADGGTNKNITASAGSVVYVDADSFEQVSGTSGQVLQSNGSSAPTFVNKSISAKSQNNTSVTAEEIQVPNNLLTQVGTNKHLNETGNKNILSNPSFEHSTFSTSWTNSSGTFTQETSTVIDGKASAKLVLSSQTMALTQSSTLYQAQFADGVQGLASVKIKSDIALNVCPIQAGSVSAVNCVVTDSSNTWRTYKVPFILGATSNGISIASSGSATGTVYIDDSFVGPMDLTSGAITCTSSSCETVLSASVSSTGVVSNENVDWISGNASKTTGIYTFTFNSGLATVPMNCTANEYGVTGTSRVLAIRSSTSTTVIVGAKSASDGTTLVDNDFQLICQKQGADWTKAEANKTGGIYSNVAGAESVDVFSAKVSSAAVISDENIDWLSSASVATSTFTVLFNTGVFNSTPNCVLTPDGIVSTYSEIKIVSANSSASQIQYWTGSTSGSGAFNGALGVRIVCQKSSADFKASKLIVGSFKNVPSIPNSIKPVQYVEEITCGTTSSLVRSLSGSSMFQSLGNISSGNCSFTLKSNLFTGEPYCFSQFAQNATEAVSLIPVFTTATTGTLNCRSGINPCASGGSANITCIGVSP